MKTAILFAGMTYNKDKGTDFRHCFPNIKKYLIDHFSNISDDVKIHLFTYSTEFDESLTLFNADTINFLNFEGSDQVKTRKIGLDYIKDKDFDVVILSRFDLHFNIDFTELNLDLEKINLVSREGDGHWDNMQFTCDTFYIIPKKFINQFISAVDFLDKNPSRPFCIDMHGLYPILLNFVDKDDIHFIMEGVQLSGHLFNSVCRKTRLFADFFVNKEVLTRCFD